MPFIELTQGQRTRVDAADFDWLNQWKWWAIKRKKLWHAVRSRAKKTVYMHRLLLGVTSPSIKVDHWDGDGLNNRRCNLRKATQAQNLFNRGKSKNNRSGYKGVSQVKSLRNPWMALLKCGQIRHYVGVFPTARQAARAYDVAARRFHGRFARLNFP